MLCTNVKGINFDSIAGFHLTISRSVLILSNLFTIKLHRVSYFCACSV